MGVSEMVRLVSPRNNCRQAGRQCAACRPAVMLGAQAGLRGQPEAGRSGVCVQGLRHAGYVFQRATWGLASPTRLSASSSVAALCTDRFLKWMFCSSSSMMVTCRNTCTVNEFSEADWNSVVAQMRLCFAQWLKGGRGAKGGRLHNRVVVVAEPASQVLLLLLLLLFHACTLLQLADAIGVAGQGMLCCSTAVHLPVGGPPWPAPRVLGPAGHSRLHCRFPGRKCTPAGQG